MSADLPVDPRERVEPAGVDQIGSDQLGAEEIGEVVRFDVVSHGYGARVVHVVGEIDTLTAPILRSRLDEQVAEVPLLVLDLSEVTFLGSAGLAVLVAANDDAERRGHRFRIVPGTRIVVRALEATGLLGLFDIADGVPQALEAIG